VSHPSPFSPSSPSNPSPLPPPLTLLPFLPLPPSPSPLLPQVQKSLVVARTIGDWVVHTCTNCDTDVYILHAVKEESRVFVTKSLLVRHALNCESVSVCVCVWGCVRCACQSTWSECVYVYVYLLLQNKWHLKWRQTHWYILTSGYPIATLRPQWPLTQHSGLRSSPGLLVLLHSCCTTNYPTPLICQECGGIGVEGCDWWHLSGKANQLV